MPKGTEIYPSSDIEINFARCCISKGTDDVGYEVERRARVNNYYSHRFRAAERSDCVLLLYGKTGVSTECYYFVQGK